MVRYSLLAALVLVSGCRTQLPPSADGRKEIPLKLVDVRAFKMGQPDAVLMLTGGSGGLHTPLYLSRSSDSGKTWGEPRPIADRGVWPNSCRMQNGVIVCTYGRPGNWLCFSLDDGRTWTGHFCFHDGPSTSYNSVEQIAPDTILVVYDRQKLDKNGNMAQAEVGTVFTVERAATTAD